MSNQDHKFEILWDKYSKQVYEGKSYVDIKSNSKEIVTLVARLPQNIAEQLAIVSGQVSEQISDLYVYPPETMHTTILFLSPYIREEKIESQNINAIKEIVRNVIYNTDSITAHIHGLGLFPTTVFAQLHIENVEKIVTLRHEIAQNLKKEGFISKIKLNSFEMVNTDKFLSKGGTTLYEKYTL